MIAIIRGIILELIWIEERVIIAAIYYLGLELQPSEGDVNRLHIALESGPDWNQTRIIAERVQDKLTSSELWIIRDPPQSDGDPFTH